MFGRGQEQTGLAGLSTSPVLSTTEPADPGEVERRRPEWPLVLVIVVLAVGGAATLIARDWGRDGAETVQAPARPGSANGPTVTAVPGSAAARGNRPYWEPAVFGPALQELRRIGGDDARAVLLRVDAGQVWTVLASSDGSRRVVRIAGGDAPTVTENPDSAADGLPLSRIDRRAPRRIITGLRHLGVRPKDVDYLVAADFPDPRGSWSAFLKARDGRTAVHYLADAHGRGLRKVG